jgi:hypothetical protein
MTGKRNRLGSAAVALAAALGTQDAQAGADLVAPLAPETTDLAAYRWSHRPVLIFAAGAGDPDYLAQTGRLDAAQAGLAERDIVVLSDTRPEAGGALRRLFGIEGFEVLLVGKDGGVKLRRDTPLSAETLFATIDRMPMRRREMQP